MAKPLGECQLRLKPEKVEHLCTQIVAALEKDDRATLVKPKDEIAFEARKVFVADLRAEDALMDEVEKVIEEHRTKIAGKNIDMQILRRKIRDQLVRERKIVIGGGSNMRLSDDRIQSIATQIAEDLRKKGMVRYKGMPIRMATTIGRVITNDLKIEAEINAEAERRIEARKQKIERGSADWNSLFIKEKEELARRRNYIF